MNIDMSKYQIKEIIQDHDHSQDELIQYLQSIIMDRSIPEENKVMVRKQFDEVMKMISITMKPPTIILEPKE